MGVGFPAWLGTDYRSAAMATRDIADAVAKGVDPATLGPAIALAAQALTDAPRLVGIPIVFNLPAFLIVMGITWVLVQGHQGERLAHHGDDGAQHRDHRVLLHRRLLLH